MSKRLGFIGGGKDFNGWTEEQHAILKALLLLSRKGEHDERHSSSDSNNENEIEDEDEDENPFGDPEDISMAKTGWYFRPWIYGVLTGVRQELGHCPDYETLEKMVEA